MNQKTNWGISLIVAGVVKVLMTRVLALSPEPLPTATTLMARGVGAALIGLGWTPNRDRATLASGQMEILR